MNQSGANTKMAGHPGSGGEPSHPGSANRAAKQQSNSILNARQSANASASPRQVREADVANSLLSLERDARQAESESELGYVMVNGSRVAVQYRQALLLLRHGAKKFRVESVSSLSAVDRNSTFIRWVEGLAKQHLAGENGSKVVTLDIRNETGASNLDAKSYPFPSISFVPLSLRDGTVFGHLMFTREEVWDEGSLIAAARLCETYSHAWEALSGPKKTKRRMKKKSVYFLTCALAVLLLGLYPVPLTVLSPAEVTPANPYVVAAPIDGVIDAIDVEPNSYVTKGTTLFEYSDTDLRNKVKLAGQAVSVAEARYTQAVRTSFSDPKAKRELSIAQSELKLKAGEYDYAKELLDNSVVAAERNGLVIFADKDSWTGRPVATGERIMRIADPNKVEITINLPVSDAIVLKEGSRVQLYLDARPLQPVEAVLTSASYHAKQTPDGQLSYRVTARFAEEGQPPRIGLRGTAQVYGEKVSLAYFLFRKPLSVIRQWAGI